MPFVWVRARMTFSAALLCAYACAGRSLENDDRAGDGGSSGAVGSSGKGGISGTGPGGYGGWAACFEAGSLVATPSGSVAIETLRVGDRVLAFDERTGGVVPKRVTATFVHEVAESGSLALEDGRVLRVTAEHPIYDADRAAYLRADAFDGGESLVTLSETLGARAPVASRSQGASDHEPGVALAQTGGAGFAVAARGAPVTVYNISVEGLENYFVEGVLVHNKSGGTGWVAGSSGTGGGPGGSSGTGGVGGVSNTAGCFSTPPSFSSGDCPNPEGCLDEAGAHMEHVVINDPVTGGAGGQAGAGGEGGDADSRDSAVPPGTAVTDEVCQPVTRSDVFVAVDFFMPVGSATTPGFAIYQGETCSGTEAGQVWFSDFAVPPPGSWTKQCVRLVQSELSGALTVRPLDPSSAVTNLRFVTSCECPRELKRLTTCGWNPNGTGGGSACE